ICPRQAMLWQRTHCSRPWDGGYLPPVCSGVASHPHSRLSWLLWPGIVQIPRDCEEMALILPRCDKNDAPLLDGDNELLPVAPPIARAPTALDQVDKLETEHVFNPRPTGEHQPRHILTHGVVH